MKRLQKIFLFFILILTSFYGQSQVEFSKQIKERDQAYSAYQKLKVGLDEDTTSAAFRERIASQEELIKLDNEILDVISEKTPKQSMDSLKVVQLTSENEALNADLSTKSMIQLYLLIGAGLLFILVIIFLVLYLTAVQRRAKLQDDFNIEKQLSQKHDSDKEKLAAQIIEITNLHNNNLGVNSDELKRNLTQKTIDVEEANKQNSALRDKIASIQSELSSVKNSKNNLENEFQELKSKSDNTGISDNVQKIQELELNIVKLEKLKKLVELSIITAEEFEAKKISLLNEL